MSYTLNIYNNVHNNSPFEAMKCRAVRDLERKTDFRCLFSTFYHSGSTSPLPSSAPEKPPARHPCSGAIWTVNLVKFLHPIEDTKSQIHTLYGGNSRLGQRKGFLPPGSRAVRKPRTAESKRSIQIFANVKFGYRSVFVS